MRGDNTISTPIDESLSINASEEIRRVDMSFQVFDRPKHQNAEQKCSKGNHDY